MTIRHFRIFTAVVDCKTMHQAAEELFMSQPNVSQAIKELEGHYKVTLFERYKKKLILTPDGQRLLEHCRILLARYDMLNQDMLEAGKNPVLRVGATVSVGEELLVGIISAFEKENPHVRVEITVNNTEYIEESILQGRLDLGIIEGQVVSGDVRLLPFFSDCMQVVAAPDSPLAGKKNIEPQELARYDIITREQGSQVRNVLLNMLYAKGIGVHIKWECTNVPTIKQAVMAGQGISLLSSLVIQRELEEGKLCILDVKGLDGRRSIHLALHKDKHRSDVLDRFILFCENYASDSSKTGKKQI